MKLRITALIFSVAMLAVLLTGCGCEHEWADATCLAPKTCNLCQETEGEALGHTWAEVTCAAPKTCTACGETEGEALPHTWVEANYQEPKTCSVCGATEGEPLPADFEVHGLSYISLKDINTETIYKYLTTCFDDTSKKTTGELRIKQYHIFSYDDTHPYKEGYEWRFVCTELRFWGVNAQDYGYSVRTATEDYYDIEGRADSTTENNEGWSGEYIVDYQGKDYLCSFEAEKSGGDWNSEGSTSTLYEYFHVPIGYDGTVIGFYDASKEWNDDMYIYDIADENTLFFRLD